jgi:hypothetical protein
MGAWTRLLRSVCAVAALLATSACVSPVGPEETVVAGDHTTSSGNHTTSSGNVSRR